MSRFTSDEQLDHELLYILNQHVGKENAINRWDLVAKMFGPVAVHLQIRTWKIGISATR